MAKSKSRSPRGYYLGGAVPLADGGPATESVKDTVAAAPAPEVNPLKTALDAQLRAEALQDPRARLMAEIEKMDVSDAKKQVLKEHPELVADPFLARAAAMHYQLALQEGHEDDSPALIERVLSGVQGEVARVQQAARRGATPVPMPEAPASYLPPTPAKRNIPISAPVSRVTPTVSGKRVSSMKLSPEEVQIARNSFSSDMTNAQKEYLYLQNRERLRAMRASGEYRQTTEQDG